MGERSYFYYGNKYYKNFLSASTAALRRVVSEMRDPDGNGNREYTVSDDVLVELLRSDATPEIRAGIQSEAGKRQILEAEARRRGLIIPWLCICGAGCVVGRNYRRMGEVLLYMVKKWWKVVEVLLYRVKNLT